MPAGSGVPRHPAPEAVDNLGKAAGGQVHASRGSLEYPLRMGIVPLRARDDLACEWLTAAGMTLTLQDLEGRSQ